MVVPRGPGLGLAVEKASGGSLLLHYLKPAMTPPSQISPEIAGSWATWVRIWGQVGHPTAAAPTQAPIWVHPE